MRYGWALEDDAMPRLVEPGAGEAEADALVEWIESERAWVEDALTTVGAVLLRGFSVHSPATFERVCRTIVPELKAYVGGESPRSNVEGRVYTSTHYAPELGIDLHSELSYARRWPERIMFACMEPAARGGETPIADTRAILDGIDEGIVERFSRLGVTYVTRYNGGWGLGRSWQAAFETESREAVEAILREDDVAFEWTPDDGLTTRAVRPAVIAHPTIGRRVWFNQADRWHVTARGPEHAERLTRLFGEEGLPRQAYYGDGSAIDADDLAHVRGVLQASERTFPWQRGDVLILDNVLAAHGRRPYEGSRLTLTAMG